MLYRDKYDPVNRMVMYCPTCSKFVRANEITRSNDLSQPDGEIIYIISVICCTG
jgi:hypothetical protein